MTQALNLALLGNNVNTSGQVSLTAGVSGTLPVGNGGTGATTLAANNVLLGNGTSAFQAVAPSTSGNVLTSNGSTWTSAAPPSPAPTTAQVLSATAGATAGAVGTYALATGGGTTAFGGTTAGSGLTSSGAIKSFYGAGGGYAFVDANGGSVLSGTWRCMGRAGGLNGTYSPVAFTTLWLRIS